MITYFYWIITSKEDIVNLLRIAYAPDENYVGITTISMISILDNTEDEDIEFIILHSGLSEKSINKLEWVKNIKKCIIRYVDVNREEFKNYPLVNWVTIAAWFRTKIADLCPDCDKVLYLDSDTMVLSSLNELFKINLEKNYIGAIGEQYFNSGVILFNCDIWRKEHVFEKIDNYVKLNRKKIKCADQDVLNAICKNRKLVLPPEYNYCELYKNIEYETMSNPKIVHFVGPNPNRFDCMHSLKYKWVEYAMLTPFFEEFINQNIYNLIKLYPKLKFDEFKFSILSKISVGKMKEKYKTKIIVHKRLLNSLKY